MTSWQQLLLLDMVRGRYLNLSPCPPTPYNWWTLWGLAYDVHKRETHEVPNVLATRI